MGLGVRLGRGIVEGVTVMGGAVFAGVRLDPSGTVTFQGVEQSVTGCHAVVDSVGAIRDRATLTRVVGGAVVAGPLGAVIGGLLRKRVDERQVFLLISGPRLDWVVPVKTWQVGEAQRFAAVLNTAAKLPPTLTEVVPDPQVQPYRRRSGVYQPGMQ